MIVGGLREVIGAGTLYGMVVFQKPILPIAALPSGGFIFLAVLVALWRGFGHGGKTPAWGRGGLSMKEVLQALPRSSPTP